MERQDGEIQMITNVATRMVSIMPCKDCSKRQLGCHSKCEDYALYKQELNEIKNMIYIEDTTQRVISEPHRIKKNQFIKKSIGKRARGIKGY